MFGGGERYPLELARALAREVACELVTFSARPREIREPGGLRVRVLRPLGYVHGHVAHPVPLGLSRVLRGADVVHTHHLRSTPSRIAAVSARARGQRLAVTDHGLGGGGWFGLLPRLFDRFLVVSAFSAAVLDADPSRTRLIYGGVDPDRFEPDPRAVRRGVLFVGRFTPHKGLDRLIAALPPGQHLVAAGSSPSVGRDPLDDGDYPQLLAHLAVGRSVTFTGPIADHQLPALYQQAAVFALPSVQRTCYGRWIEIPELLGLAVLEAMASGLPVVCSRLGGVPEIVRDGENGFLVEPGAVDELRDRLALLLSDRALAERMGRNGRALALERFTWSACAQRCLQAYRELLEGADQPTGAL